MQNTDPPDAINQNYSSQIIPSYKYPAFCTYIDSYIKMKINKNMLKKILFLDKPSIRSYVVNFKKENIACTGFEPVTQTNGWAKLDPSSYLISTNKLPICVCAVNMKPQIESNAYR